MFRRIVVVIALSGILISMLLSCTSAPSIPPAEQFTQVPVGTTIPYEKHGAPVALPEGMSGAMFINQKKSPIRVAVSTTITSVMPGDAFLFVLPPADYQFYVYEMDSAPSIRAEKLEAGKLRYVYLFSFVAQ